MQVLVTITPLRVVLLLAAITILPVTAARASDVHGIDLNSLLEGEEQDAQQQRQSPGDDGEDRGRYIGRPPTAGPPALPPEADERQPAEQRETRASEGQEPKAPASLVSASMSRQGIFSEASRTFRERASTQPVKAPIAAIVGPTAADASGGALAPETRRPVAEDSGVPGAGGADDRAPASSPGGRSQVLGDLEQAAMTVDAQQKAAEKEKAFRKAARLANGKAPTRLLDQVGKK
jgi:hypothetical protein